MLGCAKMFISNFVFAKVVLEAAARSCKSREKLFMACKNCTCVPF